MFDVNLQIWEPRAEGWKPTRCTLLQYKTGTTPNEYVVMVANHRLYSGSDAQWTGTIAFACADAYWQGTRLQVKEVANGDPLALGMDTTTDVAYANLHGFTVDSIAPGGWRVLLLKVVGTGLTFTDAIEAVTLTYPAAA